MRRSSALALALAFGCSSRPHVGVERDQPAKHDGGRAPAVVVVERAPSVRPRPDRAGLTFVDEREPDDDLQHAQPLEMPKGVRGTIGEPRAVTGKPPRADEDWYQWLVGGEARQSARVELSGVPAIALALDALDGDGNRLTGGEGGEGEAVVIPDLAVEPGKTYFLRVKPVARPKKEKAGAPPPSDPGHGYELVVLPTPLQPGDEEEPNDAPDHASAVPPGADASGWFGRRKDDDWLRVSTEGPPPGATLRLELSAVEGVAPSLQVADGAGQVLATATGGKGDELRLRNAPSTQPVTLVHLRAESGVNTEARWTLRAQWEAPLPVGAGGAEAEPNDTRERATPLPVGIGAPPQTVSGFLWPGDVDWYRVRLDGPALARVELAAPEKVNLQLELQAADGATLRKVDDGGAGQPEVVPAWFVPSSGDLFVKVSARGRESAFDAPYRLTVTDGTDDGATEHEPNDAPSAASAIAPGRPERGWISPRGDEDWYRVVAPDGAQSIRAALTGGPRGAVVKLLDEQRAPLGPAGGASASAPVQPGKVCFVVVRVPDGKTASADPYSLTVSF